MAFPTLIKTGLQTLGSDIYGNAMNATGNFLNGFVSEFFADRARKKNYEYNEKAANEADKRQRAQYQDLYSPQAQMEQYAAAGLSPSMMMSGGQSAVGGTPHGPLGGLSGPMPSASGGNSLQGPQIANLLEDAKGKAIENAMKEITKNMQEIKATKLKYENELLMTYLYDDKGNKSSLGDHAQKSKSFAEFKKDVMKQDISDTLAQYINSENGEDALRAIYKSRHELENDIAVLSSSKMNAQVMEKVSRLLYNSDYAEQNRDATLNNLKQISESADLTATQKEAFNNLIGKLGDGTFKDIVVVLMSILSNFQHSQIKLNTGGQSFVTNNTENNW